MGSDWALASGVEALVSWLLDHPDVQITELSDADTVSDEYSDEEVLEELEEPEPTFSVVRFLLLLPQIPHFFLPKYRTGGIYRLICSAPSACRGCGD